MFDNLNKYIFLFFFILLAGSFWVRSDYRAVDKIVPEVLNEPLQTETGSIDLIKFKKNGYDYELTPLYNYDIRGLVVHKMNYSWFTIYKGEKVFSTDLCLIWGNNVKNKVFKNNSVKFSQDCRWCNVEWYGNVDFNLNQLSNNHLIAIAPDLLNKIAAISSGDQVRIKGKLVYVKARPSGKAGNEDYNGFEWRSSVTRDDTGAGACEVIFVEDAQILAKAHPIACGVYFIGLFGLILMVCVNFARFLYSFIK
jgi:hypothetical protein